MVTPKQLVAAHYCFDTSLVQLYLITLPTGTALVQGSTFLRRVKCNNSVLRMLLPQSKVSIMLRHHSEIIMTSVLKRVNTYIHGRFDCPAMNNDAKRIVGRVQCYLGITIEYQFKMDKVFEI